MDSNLIRNIEAKNIVQKFLNNSIIYDFIDLRNLNGRYKLNDNLFKSIDFVVVTDAFVYLLSLNDDASFDGQEYNFESFLLSDIAVDNQGRLLVFYSKELEDEEISFYIDFAEDELTIYFDGNSSVEEQLKIFLDNLFYAISERMMVDVKKVED